MRYITAILISAVMLAGVCVKAGVTPAVEARLTNGDPAAIAIGGHLGGRIDACIATRVMGQDVRHLTEPFYERTETNRWQSEFFGKWALGAVLSYRYCNDARLLNMITEGVAELIGSQTADGYIGNYSPDAQLAHWDVWGRKYSMLGLVSYYDLSGDRKALEAARRVADHLMTQVGPGKADIVTTGNYQGMASSSVLEPMVLLYRRTGDGRYLDFARYIVARWETLHGPGLIGKALSGVPVAERFPHPATIGEPWFGTENGQKAYEMMSCYEGLLELYKITGEEQYLDAVTATVRNIIDTEINIAGSGSAFECWYHGIAQQTRPTYHTMETCVTMTWMKLCQSLLTLTGDPSYADQIEISAYNALLASMKNDASQIAKYSPLEGQRHPGEEQCGMHINCCNANGPRAFALLPQIALMQSIDGDEIFVNLYTDLTAQLPLAGKKKVTLSQQTAYPADGRITLSVDTERPERFTLCLRIPAWSAENSVTVNGESPDGAVTAGDYFRIERTWQRGDVVVLDLDVRGRTVRQNGYTAVVRGPVVLARDSRLGGGFVDETAVIPDREGYIDLLPAPAPEGVWMAFKAPMVLGTDLEGDARNPKSVPMCDFASAGATWDPQVRYRVWIPETLNATREVYEPYNK